MQNRQAILPLKRVAIIAVLMLSIMPLRAQEVYKYWVAFTDKDSTSYSLDRPLQFLSETALQRRAAQHIDLDSLDLPVSSRYLQALSDMGYGVQHRSRWLNGAVIYSAADSLGTSLYSLPFIREVRSFGLSSLSHPEEEPLQIADELPGPYEYEPFDASYYFYGYEQINQLSGIRLHSEGYEGQGRLIGVCDGGFPGVDTLPYFDSLRSSGRLLAVRDFVWQGDDVFSTNQHGTLVMSNLAAYVPGLYVGTAPKASYVLCRTENTYSESLLEEYNWVAAAEYLDSLGADIITTSLGYFYFDDSTTSHTLADLDGRTAPMSRAAEIAVSRGILVLNSAGNDGNKDPQHLNVPADAEHVLTVGASVSDGSVAAFSSYGPTADNRVKPDVLALGQGVACVGSQGLIGWANGTSMSCPILAGMMACLWQRFPQLTPQQLCDSVRSWGSMASLPDQRGGYGIPDFSRAFRQDSTAGIREPERSLPELFVSHGILTVKFTECPAVQSDVVLIDMQGRECFRRTLAPQPTTQQFDLSTLPAGIYVARIGTASYKLNVICE